MSDVRSMLWIERIDSNAVAACCYFQETHKGVIYGAGTFLLMERRGHDWRDRVEAKLKDELRRGTRVKDRWMPNRHGMPVVGMVRDLNRL